MDRSGLLIVALAVVALAVLATVAVEVGRTLFDYFYDPRFFRSQRSLKRPGFEVKLNTGEEPVTEKKENDHG